MLAADLTRGPDTRRWPVFRPSGGRPRRQGRLLPAAEHRPAIGTLDFYRDTAGALADRDLRTALWVRDAVTFTPLNRHTADDFPRMGEGR
ncbi:hypothetical protein ACFV2Z_33055 [Streptomyces sp. NPDC059688]|uniref:hypothetical protein n=1 Tax=Streptomyces sp. NPDC059688 TaxID=3346906 RepID=UPI0036AE8058